MGFHSVVKNLHVMQETWVQSLGKEDPLEKEMQATPVFLPGKIPWMEEPGGLQSIGSQRVGQDLATEHTQLTEHLLRARHYARGTGV